MANMMFFFPCRVWYLSVFSILRWRVVVHLCRLTQQVIFLNHCKDLSGSQYVTLLTPLLYEGVKFSSTLLVWALAWSPLSSSFSSFWLAFCQRWGISFSANIHGFRGQITLVSYLIIVPSCVCCSHRKAPFMCWLLAAGRFLFTPSNLSAGTSK